MLATNSCPAVRDLQSLARTELDGKVAQLLRQHLEQCPRCREIVQLFQVDASAQDTRPEDEPPPAQPPVDPSGTWRGGLRAAPVASAPPQKPLSGAGPAVAVAPGTAKPRSSADTPLDVTGLLSPPESPEEVGRLGPYRIFRQLGSGATGVVFLAEDMQLRRQVALKVMKPTSDDNDVARQRFLREGQAAAVIDHENIVAIYQVGAERGIPYLAMKLLEGETLDARLKREGQLFVHEVLQIGRQVAAGLAAAHDHGLIHRDIKPANIFLEAGSTGPVGGPRTGRVKIVDFGLARAAGDDNQLTRTGTIVGTPAYMSPEQARGLRVDHRSDLFSLGCLLYRICAGRAPFQADDTMAMFSALIHEHPPSVQVFNSAVPDLLAGLINKLLAKLPEGRPQSAHTVVAQLDAMAELVASARNTAQLRDARRTGHPLWVTFLQLLVVAGLGFAIYRIGPAVYKMIRHEVYALSSR